MSIEDRRRGGWSVSVCLLVLSLFSLDWGWGVGGETVRMSIKVAHRTSRYSGIADPT